jgi:hypothetical protein
MSNPVSDKQLSYIRSLVTERSVALNDLKPTWLVQPTTTKDASRLIDLLKTIPVNPVDVSTLDQDLVADITLLKTNLSVLDAKDASFALSLCSQFERKGALSEKQLPYVKSLITKVVKILGGDTPETTTSALAEGVYFKDDKYILIYTTKKGYLAGKLLTIFNGKGHWNYAKGIMAGVTADHRLTAEQASVFGKTHAFCVFCARDLTDQRSLAVGYGPTCADNYDLPYPTLEECGIQIKPCVVYRQGVEYIRHELVEINYVSHYNNSVLGTYSSTTTYKCANCDHTESRDDFKNYSGD